LLIFAVMMVTGLVVAQTPAHAALGDLWFVRTIGNGIPGAVAIGPVNALGTAEQSAVSPDGTSVYVVSPGNATTVLDAISHFRRAADRSLSFAGCIGAVAGCASVAGLDTSGMRDVVALNDNLYVVSATRLFVFNRAPNGDLGYQSCYSVFWSDPCTVLSTLYSPRGITATAGGTDVYVLSDGSGGSAGAVNHFRRDPVTGSLTYAGCLGDGRPLCTATAVSGTVRYGNDIVVSGDGTSVYVVAADPGSVAHFRRDWVTGSLAYAGCIGRPILGIPLAGCSDPGTDALWRAFRITVAPGGNSLYVTSRNGVSHLRRVPTTGDLWFAGCIGSVAGCRADGPPVVYTAIVATPDGQSVYVTAERDPASGRVIHLRRDPAGGDLYYAGCIGENTSGWCTEIGLVGAMRMATSVVASPDSANLYVTAGTGIGAITQFERAFS
jgi:DNA-binding beta-propeller fold protein YncE